jgi:hypothetical protein
MLSAESRQARARLGDASAKYKRAPNDADLADRAIRARREYQAAALADHIRRVVDAAPPLTPEQRNRLLLALRSAS